MVVGSVNRDVRLSLEVSSGPLMVGALYRALVLCVESIALRVWQMFLEVFGWQQEEMYQVMRDFEDPDVLIEVQKKNQLNAFDLKAEMAPSFLEKACTQISLVAAKRFLYGKFDTPNRRLRPFTDCAVEILKGQGLRVDLLRRRFPVDQEEEYLQRLLDQLPGEQREKLVHEANERQFENPNVDDILARQQRLETFPAWDLDSQQGFQGTEFSKERTGDFFKALERLASLSAADREAAIVSIGPASYMLGMEKENGSPERIFFFDSHQEFREEGLTGAVTRIWERRRNEGSYLDFLRRLHTFFTRQFAKEENQGFSITPVWLRGTR